MYSELISDTIVNGGPHASKSSPVKMMRSVKKVCRDKGHQPAQTVASPNAALMHHTPAPLEPVQLDPLCMFVTGSDVDGISKHVQHIHSAWLCACLVCFNLVNLPRHSRHHVLCSKCPLLRLQVTLKLIETFVDKCEDVTLVTEQLVPAMMDPILGDYQRNVSDARCACTQSSLYCKPCIKPSQLESRPLRLLQSPLHCLNPLMHTSQTDVWGCMLSTDVMSLQHLFNVMSPCECPHICDAQPLALSSPGQYTETAHAAF